MSICLLLEGFDRGEARGFHGRWIHGVGPEGHAARARGASSIATEHVDTRDKLTNLAQGQKYALHGPRGQVGEVHRTAQGWAVTGPTEKHDRVHKTPSAAAGHAMKLQRSASSSPRQADVMRRNWRSRQEVAGMNARQAQRAEQEAERTRELAARRQAQADLETSRRRKLDPNAPAAKPYKPPTEDAIRQAQKDGLEFGATPAQQQDRHGGFKIGDVAQYRTPSIVNGKVEGYSKPQLRAVSGLQRNGYLRLRDPATGTTVDVHHSNATKIGPLHPSYRGAVVQDAYKIQNAQLAAEKAARARRITESVLGSLLEGR